MVNQKGKKHEKIDLKTKYEVINFVKSGMKKEDVRKKFDLKNRANINRIMKNEIKIVKAYESLDKKHQQKTFKIKGADHPQVEEALVLWMQKLVKNKIPISGKLLMILIIVY